MNDTLSPTPRSDGNLCSDVSEGSALPVAGTSALRARLSPTAEARPSLSTAAPSAGRPTVTDGEDGHGRPEKRGGARVVRCPPAVDPPAKPTVKPTPDTPRRASGTPGNPAERTRTAGPAPAPVIFTGGGKLAGADLTRRTVELAAEYGVSEAYVKRTRTQYGVTAAQRKRPERVGPLTGADLSRPTKELVAAYGVTAGAVNRARVRAGIRNPGTLPSVLTLPGVDLSRSTKSLAAEYSLSYSAIAKVRKRLGITEWEGRRALPGQGKRNRGGGRGGRSRAEQEERRVKAETSARVKRVAQVQALAPEPTEKSDAWIMRELQADTTPVFILARRWREPLDRVQALAARIGRGC